MPRHEGAMIVAAGGDRDRVPQRGSSFSEHGSLSMRVWPGRPYPLGATWDGAGVNFALFSEHATKVELCLFDSADDDEGVAPHRAAASRPTRSGTATCPTCVPGQLYGYRVHGPYEPGQGPPLQPEQGGARPLRQGDRPRRAVGRRAVRLQDRRRRRRPVVRRPRQRRRSRRWPRSSTPAFTWGDDRPPRTPWHKTLIYELHVKGFTHAASRTCPRSCAAPTPALASEAVDQAPARAWASRPSSCCRSTTTSTTATWSRRG